MKNLLSLKNKFILISALIVTISGCGYAYQEKPKTDKVSSGKTKTKSTVKKNTGSASTSTVQPSKKKESTKKEHTGTEIKHQSDDQKKLDSLKAAKDKGKGIK